MLNETFTKQRNIYRQFGDMKTETFAELNNFKQKIKSSAEIVEKKE